MIKHLSLAALSLFLCAGQALAQNKPNSRTKPSQTKPGQIKPGQTKPGQTGKKPSMPLTWTSVDGSFKHQGQDVAITVERATRQAFLFESREGPEPSDPMSTIRSAPVTLSPSLFKQLEKAIAQAKPIKHVTMKRGDEGKLVSLLQKRLNEEGAGLTVDGDFGPATERAIRAYQQANHLGVTGTLDVETRDMLAFFSPTGHLTVNALPQRAYETVDNDVSGTLRLIVETVLNGEEPTRRTLRGKIVEFDHGLQIYAKDPAGKGQRYNVTGWHPKLEHAASLLGEVTAEAYVFESKDPETAGDAILLDLKVKATKKSLPKGVKEGELVKVTGLRKVPSRTIQTPKGPKLVSGTVVAVETKEGKKGLLENPYASAMTPKENKTGIAAAIANKEQQKAAPQGQAGPR